MQGIDHESDFAPRTMADAARDFFDDRNSRYDLDDARQVESFLG
jgi:hypothetical protein